MGNLNDVAQLADKIMEVATPSPLIVAVNTPSELERLRSEVAELKSMLQGFQSSKRSSSRQSSGPDSPPHTCQNSVGTTLYVGDKRIDRLKPAHLEATELTLQLPDISPSTSTVPSSQGL